MTSVTRDPDFLNSGKEQANPDLYPEIENADPGHLLSCGSSAVPTCSDMDGDPLREPPAPGGPAPHGVLQRPGRGGRGPRRAAPGPAGVDPRAPRRDALRGAAGPVRGYV